MPLPNVDYFNIWGEWTSFLHGSLSGYNIVKIHCRRVKSLYGAFIFLGYVPLSPLPCEMREGKRQTERSRAWEHARERQRGRGERERLREDPIGLAALAGGYSLCCHGNSREEEEEGLVSLSWGRASPLVCEPTSGPGWDNTPAGDLSWKAARLKY